MNETRITAEPGQQALVITREFDAPRELVFKTHVDPELYSRWFARLDVFEPRQCGRYRYYADAHSDEFAFSGVFHEVTAPERIISTFEFDTLPERGHVGLATTTFEALPGGRTRLTAREVYSSVADRDAAIQSGMESGIVAGYERLDNILEAMAQKA